MTPTRAAGLPESGDSLHQRWCRLNDWLARHRYFWEAAPFMEPAPEWLTHHPELARRVTGLSDRQCQALAEDSPALARLAGEIVPSLQAYADLVAVPELSVAESERLAATLPEVRATDMPGRKRLQSGALVAALQPLTQPVLDWCCGKGHLSRTLAANGPEAVVGYEWNEQLVRDGNRLARQFGDAVSIHCADVMAPGLSLPPDVHGVALHACGDLHRQLLRRATEARLPRLSFSPCCYHLMDAAWHQPVSRRARAEPERLRLSRADLRLAVRETVTAPARVRAQGHRISQWRLGFDGLQRQLRGQDDYLSVPSHPPRLLHEGFPEFCRWAAAKKGLTLPADTCFDHWLGYGERRRAQVQRHELIRHLFRRPLELWLVMDYAMFLEESGYRVRLGRFCDRSLTPRNLLLDAWRATCP